jgi:hypothetical protein
MNTTPLTTPPDTTFTYAQVLGAVNRAANDIEEAADLPDTGVIDALNLLVNAAAAFLVSPTATLDDVAAGYDCKNLATILGWFSQLRGTT